MGPRGLSKVLDRGFEAIREDSRSLGRILGPRGRSKVLRKNSKVLGEDSTSKEEDSKF